MVPDKFWNLHEEEIWWRDNYSFLQRRGYMLRPRYHPDWVGSWVGTDKNPVYCEDSVIPMVSTFVTYLSIFLNICQANGVLDAVRLSDNTKVTMKKISTSTTEIPIALYLSSDELRSDPRNRTVPILDIIQLTNDDAEALLVMPLLHIFTSPKFTTRGEFIEFMHQMLMVCNINIIRYILSSSGLRAWSSCMSITQRMGNQNQNQTHSRI